MSRAIEVEHWIRFELPKLLNLSASKRQNMGIFFYGFADYLRILESSDPKMFNIFIDEFKKRAQKISKRQPRKPYPKEMRDRLSKNGYKIIKEPEKVLGPQRS